MHPKTTDDSMLKKGVCRQNIDAASVGRRIDNYLFSILKKVPQSRIYRMIRSGEVRVDGSRVKPYYRLQVGEEIRIPPVQLKRPSSTPLMIDSCEEQRIRKSILYEDDILLVLNKPAGYAMHAGSRCNIGLTEMLRQLFYASLVPVHRLDQGTSGCLLFSKTRSSLRELHRNFQHRLVKKRYLALAVGRWDMRRTRVTAPLTVRHRRQGPNVQVDGMQGYAAETQFEIARRFGQATLLRVSPLSGRMHQIRVHAAYCGYPIAGDQRYGDFVMNRWLRRLGLKRLFLHAEYLAFDFSGRHYAFDAPLPDELSRFLDIL